MIINEVRILWPFLIGFAVFCVFFSILVSILTTTYRERYIRFYSVFFGLNFRELLVFALATLFSMLCIYFLIFPENFGDFGKMLIFITVGISAIISIDFKIIIWNLISAAVGIYGLDIYRIMDKYIQEFHSNEVLILKYVFAMFLLVFALFVLLRIIYILQRDNKYTRRLKNGA